MVPPLPDVTMTRHLPRRLLALVPGDPVTAMWLGGALALAALGLGAVVRAPQ